MTEMLKLGLVLMLVALIAAVALGLVNSRTAPIIEIQQELAKQNAMSEVASSLMPDDSLAFDSLSISDLENPYASCDELLQVVKVYMPPDTSRIGYVFIAYGKGYSSTLQTMVATRMDGRIAGTIILFQQETPGLGANIVKPAKLIGHLTGMTAQECLLKKDGGAIDAMTGCTITSRAVVNSVRQGLEDMDGAGLFSNDIAADEELSEGGAE
ncbi:MAG: RnfABCDGE type electron transport complex subunit G [Candidatus Fermentibacteraceae bacterium]|nr:RnfABCDGE type electron transport complex subunit G [Candidatus Fermentibacteraceae bacterium]